MTSWVEASPHLNEKPNLRDNRKAKHAEVNRIF